MSQRVSPKFYHLFKFPTPPSESSDRNETKMRNVIDKTTNALTNAKKAINAFRLKSNPTRQDAKEVMRLINDAKNAFRHLRNTNIGMKENDMSVYTWYMPQNQEIATDFKNLKKLWQATPGLHTKLNGNRSGNNMSSPLTQRAASNRI